MATKDFSRVLYKETQFDEIFDEEYLKTFYKSCPSAPTNLKSPIR